MPAPGKNRHLQLRLTFPLGLAVMPEALDLTAGLARQRATEPPLAGLRFGAKP
jgi:hypothetical protein